MTTVTRDEIIKLAREAGFVTGVTLVSGEFHHPFAHPVTFATCLTELERFAALVASAERERIAQMIEEAPPLMAGVQNNEGGCLICGFTPKLAAAAIRARGNL